MAVTQDELNDFQSFATEHLARGGAESMAQLVAAWEARRQHRQSIDALNESHADAESGRVIPADEVFAEARKSLDLQE